jgi:transcription initiation factor TFIID subunit TAF12
VCVEAEDYFAKFDAVSVDQRSLIVSARQLLIIHYYRVGLRKIRDRPASITIGQPRVLPAHGTRLQSDMLRRTNGVPAKDQLRQLARRADESNLPMACLAGEHFEAPWKQLKYLFGWSLKPYRLG